MSVMPIDLNPNPPVGPVQGQGGPPVGSAPVPAGAVLPGTSNPLPVGTPIGAGVSPISEAAVNAAVRQLNQSVQATSSELQFSVDKQTDRIVVKVIDMKTNQVIRQIPSQDILSLDHRMQQLAGILLRARA
ncbi:MAG: hypothetical protein B7Z66_05295 [Chromatiales bacterium 21-64-14]|nr:MAG: hypothetical protein B7Z66_05295 [Chromatiales bacterium 21-64-14]